MNSNNEQVRFHRTQTRKKGAEGAGAAVSSKLLFVNSSLSDGGSERAMSLVAQALARNGHHVTMLLVREKERTYGIDERVNIKQLRYQGRSKMAILVQRMYQIRREARSGRYTHVVSYMWDLNVTTLAATLGLPVKVVVSERSFPGARSRRRVGSFFEQLFYRFAFRIVYQTPDAREYCPESLLDRSIVIPNMIEQPASTARITERDLRIVSVGRLRAQKNFPLLIRSFAVFNESHPDWSLEIYGRGELEAELKELVRELHLVENVRFMGYVADIVQAIRTAGMFALASDYEGISNATSEAMALGIPVVCTDCPAGGAALLINDRESGLLVPVGDQEAFVQALRSVASSLTLADTLSSRARASIARFEPDKLVTTWEKEILHQ